MGVKVSVYAQCENYIEYFITMIEDLLKTVQSRMPILTTFLSLLLLIVGVIDQVAGIFDVPSFPRRLVLTIVIIVGGLIVLTYSVLPYNRNRYQAKDRWTTLIIYIAASIGLVLLTYQSGVTILMTTFPEPTTSTKNTFLYNVRIQSQDTNQGISNAEVSIELPDIIALRSSTGADGLAIFEVDNAHEGQLGKIIVKARGYRSEELNLIFKDGSLPILIRVTKVP